MNKFKHVFLGFLLVVIRTFSGESAAADETQAKNIDLNQYEVFCGALTPVSEIFNLKIERGSNIAAITDGSHNPGKTLSTQNYSVVLKKIDENISAFVGDGFELTIDLSKLGKNFKGDLLSDSHLAAQFNGNTFHIETVYCLLLNPLGESL